VERREVAYGSQAQAAPAHAAPLGAGRLAVEVALAKDAGGPSEPLDPPQNFHGLKSAADLVRIEAETVEEQVAHSSTIAVTSLHFSSLLVGFY